MTPVRRSRSQSPMRATSRAKRNRASLSCSAATMRRWTPMSRAILEPPTMCPEPSRIGEIVTDRSRRRPSLASRTVSNGATSLPSKMSARISISSSRLSGGMSIWTDWPRASAAL